MRKLMNGWCHGNYNYKSKLSAAQNLKLSESLIFCNSTRPKEIHRNIRSVKQLKLWKGSEYRTVLMYCGIVVLKDILPLNVYQHFIYLFCANFIFSTEKFCKYFSIANNLLRDFVADYIKIYGRDSISSNIHNLIHVFRDVEKFGSLKNISAYKFENYLGQFKKLLRHGNFPLSQIANRVVEKMSLLDQNTLKNEISYPLLHRKINDSMFMMIKLSEDFILQADLKNNWFLTDSLDIVSMIGAME